MLFKLWNKLVWVNVRYSIKVVGVDRLHVATSTCRYGPAIHLRNTIPDMFNKLYCNNIFTY